MVRQRRAVWLLFALGMGIAWTIGANIGLAADEPPKEAPPAQNFLVWLIHTSGPIGAVIFVLSIFFVQRCYQLFTQLRQPIVMPPEILSQSEELLKKFDFPGVFNLVKGNNSFYAKVVTAGITELNNGVAAAREAMHDVGESETGGMERKISVLAVLGTLGPMIGLLGTLSGMIGAFGEIARGGGGQTIDPAKVAGFLSEALVITFEGVALSVPSIWFYAHFKNRISELSVDCMLKADHFLRQFHAAYNARKRGATAPAAPNSAPQAPATTAPPAPGTTG